jgi:hypothetical protein
MCYDHGPAWAQLGAATNEPLSQRVMVAKGACLDPAKAGAQNNQPNNGVICPAMPQRRHPTAPMTRTAPRRTSGYQARPITKQLSQTTIDRSQAGFGVLSSHSTVAVPG